MAKPGRKKQKGTTRLIDKGRARRRAEKPSAASDVNRYFNVYLLFALLVAIILFVFRDFVLLKKVYLFKDIGSDSINYFYPHYAALADYIRTDGWPGWSFYQGMGQNIFPFSIGEPFSFLYLIFGKSGVPYAFIFVELLKIFGSGLIFYFYLGLISVTQFTRVIGAILYAFCGYLILTSGGWYNLSYEPLFAALLFLALEKFLKDNVWWPLPLIFAVICSYQPFYLYLFGLLLLGYTLVRLFEEERLNVKELFPFYLKLSACVLLGVAISALFFVANLVQILQSPRIGGEASYFHILSSRPALDQASSALLLSSIARAFSTDLLGTGSSFHGAKNYLESPEIYCGLVALLLAPQAFVVSRRMRVVVMVLGAVSILPLVFPHFRYSFWLFTGDYFRTMTFFISLVMMYLSVRALSVIDERGKIGRSILIGSLLVLMALLYLPFLNKDQLVDSNLRVVVTALLILYGGLLSLMGHRKYKHYAMIGLLVVTCAEAAYFSSVTVNRRPVISASELTQKVGYNDYTNDAVNYLKSIDRDFFRVDKYFSSGLSRYSSINDGQMQNYFGTTCYHQFNQKYYIRFQENLDLIQKGSETETRWAHGTGNRPLLESLVSVKYNLTKQSDANAFGPMFEPIADLYDVHVYKNRNYLPLGFCYDSFVPASVFSKLSNAQKDQTLLKAFVIEGQDQDRFRDFKTFDTRNLESEYSSASLEREINARRKDSLSIAEHRQNHIVGTIAVDDRKLMFFSIPYDKGWSATVDGQRADLLLINTGFMGLILEKGPHSVDLRFTPPYRMEGVVVSLISLLAYGFLLYHYGRFASGGTKAERNA